MDDVGGQNRPVGHRRKFLYPELQQIGIGYVEPGASSAVWVGAPGRSKIPIARMASVPAFVAHPSPGFWPNYLLPTSRRWSFALPNAHFMRAAVTVHLNGKPIPVSYEPFVAG